MTRPPPPGAESPRNTRILAGDSFSGRIKCGDLTVAGSCSGQVHASGCVRVDPDGHLEAAVVARVVEVAGHFTGEVSAQRLLLRASAVATGTFRAENIAVEDGAIVEGGINALRPAGEARNEQALAGSGSGGETSASGERPENVDSRRAGRPAPEDGSASDPSSGEPARQ